MTASVNSFLGDSPGRTAIKLIVVCLLVGFVLAWFGYTPNNILYYIEDHFRYFINNGFSALGDIGNYLLLGAIVVIPIFIVLRLMSYKR